MEYPKYGCWTFFAPNALADEYRDKITLVETIWNNKLAYRVKGLPCWRYIDSRITDPYREPDLTMNTFDDKGCWSGWCTHHAIVHTAILQERTKGGWNIIDGVQLKAVGIKVTGAKMAYHDSMEIYIKNKGYFRLDVGVSRVIMAAELAWWVRKGHPTHMGNRYFCNTAGDYLKNYYVSYDSEWAGFPWHEIPPEPIESYLHCTSSPSNARIWLKKH